MFEGLTPAYYESDDGWLDLSEVKPGMIGVAGTNAKDSKGNPIPNTIVYYKYEVIRVLPEGSIDAIFGTRGDLVRVKSFQDNDEYSIPYWTNLRVPESERWKISSKLTDTDDRIGVFR